MPKYDIAAGATSETIDIFIQDTRRTDGGGLVGLVYDSTGLTAYYNVRRGTSTAITLANLAAADSAWSSGGFKEIDATNQPGRYRFDVPDTLLSSGQGRYVGIMFKGATWMVPLLVEIELTGWDNQQTIAQVIQAIWDKATAALTTAGSIGKLLVENVNATISSRAQAGDAMALTSGERTTLAGVIWANATRTLTSFGTLVADIWAAVIDSAGVTTLLARLTPGRAGNLDNLDDTISGIPAAVKPELVDALATDTYPEPPQESPPATTTLAYRLRWLYKINRNKITQTDAQTSVYNDAGDTIDQKAAVDDNGTTFTRDEFQSGP